MTRRRVDQAVRALELAAANAMRTSRSPAARRAVRDALEELRIARLVEGHAAPTEVAPVAPETPEPPAGHPAAQPLEWPREAACETPSKAVRSAGEPPRGYLSAHLSCPEDDDADG